MKGNLLRISKISKADNLPVERSTLYKWKQNDGGVDPQRAHIDKISKYFARTQRSG